MECRTSCSWCEGAGAGGGEGGLSLSLFFSRGSLEGDWTDGGQMADRWRTDESERARSCDGVQDRLQRVWVRWMAWNLDDAGPGDVFTLQISGLAPCMAFPISILRV